MTTRYAITLTETDLMLAENALFAYFVQNRYSDLASKQMIAKMSDELANFLRDTRIAYIDSPWED